MKRHDPGRDHDRMLDLVEYCSRLVELPGSRTFDDFMSDDSAGWEFRAAVYHGVYIVCEIVKNLSAETKSLYPADWTLIIRMRDKLAHHYDKVDYGILWETMIIHIPDLLGKISPSVEQDS